MVDRHECTEGWQTGGKLCELVVPAVFASAIAVRVGSDEDNGPGLPEPSERGLDSEVWRDRRPDRANRRGRQKRNHRFREIGQVAGDAVTWLHPEASPGRGYRSDLPAKAAVGDLLQRPVLAQPDDRHCLGIRPGAGETALGEVDAGPGEPPRARHLLVGEHLAIRGDRAKTEELPDARPEPLEV